MPKGKLKEPEIAQREQNGKRRSRCLVYWVWRRKRAACSRGERVSQGEYIQYFALWGLPNCSDALRKHKGFNRCSGCVFGLTVGGQLHCPLISQADSACSSITGASSFKILFSSSRLVTRIKESCSMKSILVSNQQCVMKVNWGRGRCKSCLHSQREFDFFEDSQQNSYCQYPKDDELCQNRVKPQEIEVEVRHRADVQIAG